MVPVTEAALGVYAVVVTAVLGYLSTRGKTKVSRETLDAEKAKNLVSQLQDQMFRQAETIEKMYRAINEAHQSCTARVEAIALDCERRVSAMERRCEGAKADYERQVELVRTEFEFRMEAERNDRDRDSRRSP